jgi:integrase
MQKRAARFAGIQRSPTPTLDDPFVLVVVDEVAFLTAYQSDWQLRQRVGVPGLHFHDLRHTVNVIAADSGAGLKDLIGHAMRTRTARPAWSRRVITGLMARRDQQP